MSVNPFRDDAARHNLVAPEAYALQQVGPRPLPLFLAMLGEHRIRYPQEAENALRGLKMLQRATPRSAEICAQIAAHNGRAALHDFGGSGEAVIFVPSLINPATILDISADRSLLRWLATQGLHPYLVDWGDVTPEQRADSIGDHISRLLVPLIERIGAPVHMVGYCLGGTMALAAAQLIPTRSLTLIAAPWRFAHYSPEARETVAQIWSNVGEAAEQIGVVPVEVLQTMFWHIDPRGTVGKYARFADAAPDSSAFDLFIRMEQWANSGAPLPYAAARDLFVNFIAHDLPGSGRWQIDGQIISPTRTPCPTLEIVSRTDRIVPAATATQQFHRLTLDRGHVGMITGSQAKSQLWEPLREWLSQPQ